MKQKEKRKEEAEMVMMIKGEKGGRGGGLGFVIVRYHKADDDDDDDELKNTLTQVHCEEGILYYILYESPKRVIYTYMCIQCICVGSVAAIYGMR